ncbi:MAG: CinA family protein [Bacteroidales bacterium]|nr:CinA family protein [Bacteroidales bacterium]
MKREPIEAKIGDLLRGSGLTLSAAESCTGGRISHLLTTISGSSSYYLGSVTSYAIAVKEKVLGVPEKTIKDFNVVSGEVAASMAEGVKKLTGSTYAVATTGLAEGGDGRYPEGTVWIGIAGPRGTETMIFQCDKGRKGNIRCFSQAALKNLYNYICKDLKVLK